MATTTVFANNNFLTQLDIQLLLRRDLVKATTASATLHINNSQTVTSTFTDTLESGQQTRFDSGFQLLRFLTKFLLILLCLGNDLLQLALFLNQVSLTGLPASQSAQRYLS